MKDTQASAETLGEIYLWIHRRAEYLRKRKQQQQASEKK